jgi:hypothetical protein
VIHLVRYPISVSQAPTHIFAGGRGRGRGGNRRHTHQNTPADIRRNSLAKHPKSLLTTDAVQGREGVRIAKAFGQGLGAVGTHANEDDLGSVVSGCTKATTEAGERLASVGFPSKPARPPARAAQAMVAVGVGLVVPEYCFITDEK